MRNPADIQEKITTILSQAMRREGWVVHREDIVDDIRLVFKDERRGISSSIIIELPEVK